METNTSSATIQENKAAAGLICIGIGILAAIADRPGLALFSVAIGASLLSSEKKSTINPINTNP